MSKNNWFRNGKADIIFGMQWGSEGKGGIAGWMAKMVWYDTVISCSGANSGHTFTDVNGRTWVHRHLPNGIVSPNLKKVLIGPGAIIDPKLLLAEIEASKDILRGVDIIVHPHAAIIYPRHIDIEKSTMIGIGSTMKGNGAAVVEKIMRRGDNIAASCHDLLAAGLVGTAAEYEMAIRDSCRILLEGAQGFCLGINSGQYPYVTSRECTPLQLCADALLPVQEVCRVIGVCRTYPIRVANRYDEDGNQVGNSGPPYPEQEETTFEAIGVPTEYTTVTKLPRRVFEFSDRQMMHALNVCRPSDIALTFCDYMPDGGERIINRIQNCAAWLGLDTVVRITCNGPNERDVKLRQLKDPCDYTAADLINGYTPL